MFVFGDAVPFLVGALPLFLFGWYFAIVPFGAVLRLCSFFCGTLSLFLLGQRFFKTLLSDFVYMS